LVRKRRRSKTPHACFLYCVSIESIEALRRRFEIITRVRTGIVNLDQMIGGGLPEGYCYLLLGGPGAGKTTFGVQYLVNGILNQSETGIYVTLDEPPFSVRNNMRENFGWDLPSLEDKMKLAIVDASP